MPRAASYSRGHAASFVAVSGANDRMKLISIMLDRPAIENCSNAGETGSGASSKVYMNRMHAIAKTWISKR